MKLICRVIKITAASYYRWVKRKKPASKFIFDENFAINIKNIYKSENGKYGYPRICIVLNNAGTICSKTKVYRYMKLLCLHSVIRIKKMNRKPKEKKNTKSGAVNIANRQWSIFQNNELWVTDVTYIPIKNQKFKWVYLSVIKDACSGFIVSHEISINNDLNIYRNSLKKAEHYRDSQQKTIIHSDNGVQYTSYFARQYAKKNNFIISLSRPGNSLDNAMCETFFSSLKSETPKLLLQSNFEDLVKMINEYINYYNYERVMLKHKGPPCYKYLKTKKSISENWLFVNL
ncbi:putative transposase [Spiroplasma alleghenense]|uniref:Putative transposase n=1 Tax=Spiroplasma alleghenense TaxID=216931 RepID=A0A345Z578_9MOLU|nr:putative transposase [Spiroplasma alleghenense]